MAEAPFLLVERDGPVVIATLNRPDERNAISEVSHSQDIADFCADMTRDASVRAVVLTGAGKAFCAGGNVKNMRDKGGMFAGSPFEIRNLTLSPAFNCRPSTDVISDSGFPFINILS